MLSRVVAVALLITTSFAKELSITDFGAKAGCADANVTNAVAFTAALAAAKSGDAVIVPGGQQFHVLGGIVGQNLVNVTVRVDGVLLAVQDYARWPTNKAAAWGDEEADAVTGKGGKYLDLLTIQNSQHVTFTSSTGDGLIDGQGVGWWNREILPQVYGKLCCKRPKLVGMRNCTDVLIERLNLLNSPSFHLMISDMARVEVRDVHVNVDRARQKELKQIKAALRGDPAGAAGDLSAGLQPEDLNTDGIDPSGRDIWIHDCTINNDDDSIAVKPCNAAGCFQSDCTRNLLIENMVLMGFGASIGSVPPHVNRSCVSNVTFRNISMPRTGKGVYVKSNPSCGVDSATGLQRTGLIENITYQSVTMTNPRWWPIWIGPQQQHEPGSSLGEKCALDYPISRSCPTQGCVTFRNILLKDIEVESPTLSPGVILGNSTNPMQNVVFDNVKVHHPGYLPFRGEYKCEHVRGTVINSKPIPSCFKNAYSSQGVDHDQIRI